VTQTIPYDYVKGDETKKAYLKMVLLKILNNNAAHLEYFLSIIDYTFIGSPNLEKSIYFCVDKTGKVSGDNGKTFFFDILNDLMPNYVYKTKAELIDVKNTKTHKQLANLKGVRILWLEELPAEKNTNAELMKIIADGKTIENEVMFGTEEKIKIMFKMFVLSSHIPKIDPKETAVYNRYKQISFNSHFDRTGEREEEDPENIKFIADTKLSSLIKSQYYNEVFNMIIDYANKYYTNGIPTIPQQFIKDTKERRNSKIKR
jgi:phage/plasmid-associated DNA primase